MKIATWNVNGIRARETQLCEWLERDRPDVVCLQELKAEPAQIPERCKLADYHTFWHDYILASRTLAARAQSCVVLAAVGTSDHAPMMMTIA